MSMFYSRFKNYLTDIVFIYLTEKQNIRKGILKTMFTYLLFISVVFKLLEFCVYQIAKNKVGAP